jgi:hypothetical protein
LGEGGKRGERTNRAFWRHWATSEGRVLETCRSRGSAEPSLLRGASAAMLIISNQRSYVDMRYVRNSTGCVYRESAGSLLEFGVVLAFV